MGMIRELDSEENDEIGASLARRRKDLEAVDSECEIKREMRHEAKGKYH